MTLCWAASGYAQTPQPQAPSVPKQAPAAPSTQAPAAQPSGDTPQEQPGPPEETDWLPRRHDQRPRPADSQRVMCSFRVSACLHAGPGVPESTYAPAFAALEQSLQVLSAFHSTLPLPDGDHGGGPAYDMYLVAEDVGGASYSDNELAPGDFDRSSAFGVVSAAAEPDCALPARVVRAVAQAVALGLDSATHDAVLAMYGSYLAHLLTPCTTLELPAVNAFQRQPWTSVLSGPRERISGALLFPSFLDSEWGTGVPLTITTAALATSTQRSWGASTFWRNEPDILDTLRANMLLRDRTLGDLLASFAVARAFVGDRSDGLHLVNTEQYGSYGRVGFEWAVDYSSLPRRLAPLHAVEPTGASYIWLDLNNVKSGANVLLHAEWEETFVMQWTAVRIDAQGIELGRLSAGGVFGHASAQLSVANLDGAAALLIVGTNLGNDDRSKPYDPEDGPPRPVGYTLTLHAR